MELTKSQGNVRGQPCERKLSIAYLSLRLHECLVGCYETHIAPILRIFLLVNF